MTVVYNPVTQESLHVILHSKIGNFLEVFFFLLYNKYITLKSTILAKFHFFS